MAPKFERLALENGMKIRTIDIGEWGSPVAEQYGIEKLPTVWYYQGSELVDDDYARILRDYGK